MSDALILQTTKGEITLRPEGPHDGDFLYALFRSHSLPVFAPLVMDDAGREALIRMQFNAQIASYRAQNPDARFDVVEIDGTAVGRLVVGGRAQQAWIVDIALLPEACGKGIGTALLSGVMARLGQQAKAVRCMVLFTNQASLRMFRRAGFVTVDSTQPFLLLEWRRPCDGETLR
jgi:ribosomal protein S18 acetylase RimI-like enzyme